MNLRNGLRQCQRRMGSALHTGRCAEPRRTPSAPSWPHLWKAPSPSFRTGPVLTKIQVHFIWGLRSPLPQRQPRTPARTGPRALGLASSTQRAPGGRSCCVHCPQSELSDVCTVDRSPCAVMQVRGLDPGQGRQPRGQPWLPSVRGWGVCSEHCLTHKDHSAAGLKKETKYPCRKSVSP